MDGVIAVNKPQNFTSFDVVAVMRRLCGQRKIGHTGTLDPMATGVLPLLLGSAAKAQDILPDSDKEYAAEFKLGVRSDTLDIWGKVTSTSEFDVSRGMIQEIIPRFKGEISQKPPMYSAVKKNGVRLYDLARQGLEIERESRIVTISKLELVGFDELSGIGQLKIACSKGTYIRSLIDDIGSILGCGAVMTSLVRTKACGFTLDDTVTIDEIKDLSNDGASPANICRMLRSCESLFDKYSSFCVSQKQAVRFLNGGSLDIEKTRVKSACRDGEIFRVKGSDGSFLGLGKADLQSGQIKIFKLFPPIA